MGWDSSDRRATLPSDWALRVRAVKKRARGRCEYGLTKQEVLLRQITPLRCKRFGRDTDHWEDRDNHDIEALRFLCGFHHDKKTRKESIAGMARKKASVKRPPERHPGDKRGRS